MLWSHFGYQSRHGVMLLAFVTRNTAVKKPAIGDEQELAGGRQPQPLQPAALCKRNTVLADDDVVQYWYINRLQRGHQPLSDLAVGL